ncbi:unnamed protein product [Leptidea sinapis]|uniref:Signal recognition particle subunit SRP72 n=1 Tax=Leptidea sinapis TaxID=189913 RepID=A0A5E4R0Y2_9NEOP|nr:unnamed protein product [Leptidea sinapis]
MSANKENNLVQAYVELNKFCQSGEYERALKASGKILQIAPTEQKAFHCKIICLIQLHNFKEALGAITNPKNAGLASDLVFEKAYTQYRLNCPKDALETVDNAPELTPALKELRAQILYRLEQYQECYNLYREIVKNSTDEYEDERKTNMSAVVANLGELNPKAEQLCSESVIDDGGTEEEAKEEAAIIRVQQAYCQQQMGKEKEATSIYQNVLKDKPSDQALVAIASNNLAVINRDANVFDSRKRMKAATQEGLEHKLNSRQKASITYNQAILAIYSNQGDRKAAIKLLEESEYKYRPGVIGVLCTLLTADNEHERASRLFTEVYQHYKNDEEQVRNLRAVWRAAADCHSRAGDSAAAARAHETLVRAAPGDKRTLARLGKIDIEALESSKWMMGAKVVKKTVQSKQEQSPGWLPKYERTAYRKRRGIRRDVIKGSQGMTTTAVDQYDMSKQTPTPAAAAKSPRVEAPKSTESAWQRKQQQKKKGKGRKW